MPIVFPSNNGDDTEMKLISKLEKPKRLMGMKIHIHHDGFKVTNVNLLVQLKERLEFP